MAHVSTIEVQGAHARLRRSLAPPVVRIGFDIRIHSRLAIGLALKRTAVPTPVLLPVPAPEVPAAEMGHDAEASVDDPDRRRRP
ncbi:hypothetical protein ACLBYM_05395 [Methylobacterium fujisawaense]